ncbi:MAG: hypothetical protein GF331_06280 [Chitinivibrionales bacterium]|nr:hypothetical protein [Chitinivibrionales bacterium]
MTDITGLLHSQIGYDTAGPKRAMLRASSPDHIPPEAELRLIDLDRGTAGKVTPVSEGNHWGSSWWSADFSSVNQPGRYLLALRLDDDRRIDGTPFSIGENVLWDTTWRATSIEQLDVRAELARDNQGWQDCGAKLREVNSHAHMIIGLADLLEHAAERIGSHDAARVQAHLIRGCDYLGICQDHAPREGFPDGAIVHEIPSHADRVIPGDVALCVVALARAAHVLANRSPDKSDEYRGRADCAFTYLTAKARPFSSEQYDPVPHGIAPGTPKPDEWMTRDLAAMLWGALCLYRAGVTSRAPDAFDLAGRMLARQIPRDAAEAGLYGHFHTFDSLPVSEKMWVHHGYGHDCGAVFPQYVRPLVELCRLFPDHADAPRWHDAVQRYARGYLIPACRANPFLLMPNGVHVDEGLLTFGGLWHGANVSYAYTAAMALELERFLEEPLMRDIAVANLQWIAGLHAGITTESLAGCERWSDTIPAGVAVPYSMIYGIGERSAGTWTNIRGTLCNGFDVDQQFKFVVPPSADTDGPHMFTDEDWISHNGAWLQALVRL